MIRTDYNLHALIDTGSECSLFRKIGAVVLNKIKNEILRLLD